MTRRAHTAPALLLLLLLLLLPLARAACSGTIECTGGFGCDSDTCRCHTGWSPTSGGVHCSRAITADLAATAATDWSSGSGISPASFSASQYGGYVLSSIGTDNKGTVRTLSVWAASGNSSAHVAGKWALNRTVAALCAAPLGSTGLLGVLWSDFSSPHTAHVAAINMSSSASSIVASDTGFTASAVCAGADAGSGVAIMCTDSGYCVSMRVNDSTGSAYVWGTPVKLFSSDALYLEAASASSGVVVLARQGASGSVFSYVLTVGASGNVTLVGSQELGTAQSGSRVSITAIASSSFALFSFVEDNSTALSVFSVSTTDGSLLYLASSSGIVSETQGGGACALGWSPAGFGFALVYAGASKAWFAARIDASSTGKTVSLSAWQSISLSNATAVVYAASTSSKQFVLVDGSYAIGLVRCFSETCATCTAYDTCSSCSTGFSGSNCTICASGYSNYPNCTSMMSSEIIDLDSDDKKLHGIELLKYLGGGIAVALALMAFSLICGCASTCGSESKDSSSNISKIRGRRRNSRTRDDSLRRGLATPKPIEDPEAGIEMVEDMATPLLPSAPVVPGEDRPLQSVPPSVSNSRIVDLMSLPLKLPMDSLHFNLQPGVQAPVRESISQDFSIPNTTPKKYAYAFVLPGRPLGEKYTLSFTPQRGIIMPGEFATVRAELKFMCTCKLNEQVAFVVSTGKGETKVKQHAMVPLRLESTISPYLDFDDLQFLVPPIGQGSSGTVYKGAYRGSDVAIKFLSDQCTGPESTFSLDVIDAKTINMLHHSNLVTFIGAVSVPGKMSIVTEFLELGSLSTFFSRFNADDVMKVKMALDIAKGINYLHDSGVLHKNIKSGNVLISTLNIDAQASCKIGDVTVRVGGKIIDLQSKPVVSPIYAAPEVIKGLEYTRASDVFSFSLVLYELFTEIAPYSASPMLKNPWDITTFVANGNRQPIPDNCPPKIADLIGDCWAQTPEARPTFQAIVAQLQALRDSMPTEPGHAYCVSKLKGQKSRSMKTLARGAVIPPAAALRRSEKLKDDDSDSDIDITQVRAAIADPESALYRPSASALSSSSDSDS